MNVLLVAVAVGGRCRYTLLSLLITHCLMRPIVGKTYVKNALEGHLRFQHVRVREFGESIAFFSVRAVSGQGTQRAMPRC